MGGRPAAMMRGETDGGRPQDTRGTGSLPDDGSLPYQAVNTPFFPDSFTLYMAASALWMSSSRVRPWSG